MTERKTETEKLGREGGGGWGGLGSEREKGKKMLEKEER